VRVAFLSNYPVPYQRELLAALERLGQLEVHPFFLAAKDPSRSWPDERQIARARILPSIGLPGAPHELRIFPTLVPELLRLRADITIVCGYSHAAFQLAMAALVLARRPFVVWAELPRIGAGSAPVRLARRALIAPINASRGLLAIGSRAALTWRSALRDGVPVVNYPYSCDIQRYREIPRAPRGDRPFTFLFSGQLIERKGVDLLLSAFIRAAAQRADLRLRLAGDGPMREALLAKIPEALRDRIELLGFVPWEALPATYAAADALVIPSRHDGWALVVNEALAAGLPVIASEAVGAAVDLVRNGVTGARVATGDVDALCAAMIGLPERATAMGAAGRDLIAALAPEAAAARLHDLLRAALRGELRDATGIYP
jgi:glycosyltransferase involved in cell wall biosynthesis